MADSLIPGTGPSFLCFGLLKARQLAESRCFAGLQEQSTYRCGGERHDMIFNLRLYENTKSHRFERCWIPAGLPLEAAKQRPTAPGAGSDMDGCISSSFSSMASS